MAENSFNNAMTQLKKAALVADIDQEILEKIQRPQRILEATLTITMDDGSTKNFTAFRVQYNDARGPFKGGIRFYNKVNIHEVKALAFWMVMKTGVVGIPMGGSKGGVIVDVKKLSVTEIERLSRAWVRAFYKYLGPRVDVPAPDVYTTPQIMGWMVDEYARMSGGWEPAAFTGKPVSIGGSEGRTEATGFGGAMIFEELFAKLKLKKGKTTVAVQGFGNVGYYIAERLHDLGYKIVAVSDSRGGIYDKRNGGMDPRNIMKMKRDKGVIDGCYCIGSVCDCENYQQITNDQLLQLPVDILIPAALENVITKKNAGKIKAKAVIEMANGPLTPDADDTLFKKGIPVVPDILSNAGGVTVSYFEWAQNLSGLYWTKDQVLVKLHEIMKRSFDDVWKVSIEKKVDLRTAAYVVALKRIGDAMKARGIASS
ncbi:MAG: glutamate dehydrogenase [Candidatus Kerfeldbacteria bacterium CG08_land_8_20_14_0_20_42_7]|uniref:Glutamate dehydrogenase n=1 Tax=Candidatus Kerfeldbacteria bacterium CG08_land_8_20_14_0_20_42_7 TaxID=2014245 RepID=A0A2H0YTN8_9BACT|nr:MAG: glutamate dehydrogenase [Candidatus Kerfeldbacteria bacterium CG08_land_8_20_14_0_20_42_7]